MNVEFYYRVPMLYLSITIRLNVCFTIFETFYFCLIHLRVFVNFLLASRNFNPYHQEAFSKSLHNIIIIFCEFRNYFTVVGTPRATGRRGINDLRLING